MTGQDAPRHHAPRWNGDTRSPAPAVGGERETLGAVLDWHRDTFALKCTGLPPELLSQRAIPPSTLSLHGLVRHLAGVERWWFRIQFAGEDLPAHRRTRGGPAVSAVRRGPGSTTARPRPGRRRPRPRCRCS